MTAKPTRGLPVWARALCASAAVAPLMAAPPAMAQASQAEPAAAARDDLTDVVVTGSRIQRRSQDATAPITVLRSEELERVGSGTAYDLLRRTPFVAMGEGAPNNNGDQYNGGAGFMNLRNLGANRSLTLVNGRRRVSGASNFSGVDLNMIPAGLIERIDIVTGGTSAIYGADAVTGAVNIILKSDFDGLEASARYGQSQYGDANYFTGYVVGGRGFANDRGRFTFGASYLRREGLMQDERPYTSALTTSANNPANTGPNDGISDQIDYTDVRYIYASFSPTFYFKNQSYIIENGAIRAGYNTLRIASGATGYGSGGDGRNINDTRKLIEPVETFSAIANVKYDLSNAVSAYLNAEFTRSVSDGWYNYYRADARTSFLNGYGGLKVDLQNPFLPMALRGFMVDNGLSSLNIDKSYGEFGMITNVHERDLINLETGLRGRWNDRYDWSVFVQYGKSDDQAHSDNVPLASNLVFASQVTTNASGAPICRDATARAAGCVPYNIFSGEPLTGAVRDYILHTRRHETLNTLFSAGGQINGEMFRAPAGPVAVVIGTEYRKETLRTIDDPLSANGEASHSGSWRDRQPDLDESYDVAEAFVEFRAPLLADLPLVDELSLDAAYRFSHYSTIGSASAWKVGLLWAPVQDLRLRASVSTSVRAPNLYELFGPVVTSFTNPSDPCEVGQYNASPRRAANCAALGINAPLPLDQSPVLFTSGSNPNLSEEESNSYTIGFTYSPSFLEGFNVSADYWNISIDSAVQSYSFQNIVNYCTNLSSTDNAFCAQVTRDPVTRQIAQIRGSSINVAELEARGVDFSLRYRQPLFDGLLSMGLNGTRLIEKTSLLVPGDESFRAIQSGGLSDPKWRVNASLGYGRGPWDVTLTGRYIGGVTVDPMASAEFYQYPTADSRFYTDLDFTYDISNRYTFIVGVNNLFDVIPPYSSSNTTVVGNYGLYDTIGQYFKVGLTAKF